MAPHTSQPEPQDFIISPFVTECILPGFWKRITSPKFQPTDDFSLEAFHDQRHLISISQTTSSRRWHTYMLFQAKSALIINLHAQKFAFTGKYGSISQANHQRTYSIILWLKIKNSTLFAKKYGRKQAQQLHNDIQGEIHGIILQQINILERSNTPVGMVRNAISDELEQMLQQHFGLTVERTTAFDLGRDTTAEQLEIMEREGELNRARQLQAAREKQIAQLAEKNLDWQHEQEHQLQSILAAGMENQLQDLLAKEYSIEEVKAKMQQMLPAANTPQIGDIIDRKQRDAFSRGISSGPEASNYQLPGQPFNQKMIPPPHIPTNTQGNNGNLYNTYPGNNAYPQPQFPMSDNPSMASGSGGGPPSNTIMDKDGGIIYTYRPSGPVSMPNIPPPQPQASGVGTENPSPMPQSPHQPPPNQTIPLTSGERYYCPNLGFVAEKLTPVQKATIEEELGPTSMAFIITGVDPAGAASGKLQSGDYLIKIADVDIPNEALLMKAEHSAPTVLKLVIRVFRAQEELACLLWDRAFPKM